LALARVRREHPASHSKPNAAPGGTMPGIGPDTKKTNFT
jgi:hypothetical protein